LSQATNSQGLPRRIPEDVQRQVRQACGFGCVICGCGIYQYEHLEPEFHEAHYHNPDAIALLCGSCHDRITRKIWPKSKAIAARNKPVTLSRGVTSDFLALEHPIKVRIGSNLFQHFDSIISSYEGDNWFRVDPPDENDSPPRINAKFFSPSGDLDLEIINNEWVAYTNTWDITFIGGVLTIRRAKRHVVLRLIFRDHSVVHIDHMHLSINGNEISTDSSGEMRVCTPTSSMKISNSHFQKSNHIIQVPKFFTEKSIETLVGFVSYQHVCETCQRTLSIRSTYENRDTPSTCICGGTTRLVVTAPFVHSTKLVDINRANESVESKQTSDRPNGHGGGINIEGGSNISIINCHVENAGVGIRQSGANNVFVKNFTTKNVLNPIVFDS